MGVELHRAMRAGGYSLEVMQSYLGLTKLNEGDAYPQDVIEIVQRYYDALCAIYQEDFIVQVYDEQENPSIDTENIFHDLAGEVQRAKKYTGEVSPDNPSVYQDMLRMTFLTFAYVSLHMQEYVHHKVENAYQALKKRLIG